MAHYKFADKNREIITEDYTKLEIYPDKILEIIKEAFNLFPYNYSIEVVKDMSDVFHVTHSVLRDIYICGKAVTPGGRKGLDDEQRIPGSGKSWTIEHEYCKKNSKVERIVFHPDYTHAEFIGQILPDVQDGDITYKFSPGVLTSILRDAYQNPADEYILVIEEINRGNTPAIFGEVFQLLDRMIERKIINGVTYPTGTSEYEISNRYMANEIYGDENHKVRIPSNLSIIGTMNTSDQNVFTLDTAFQRRWNMRLVENSFKNVRLSLANAKILDTNVSWQHFCEKINDLILDNKNKLASSEDKRLGVYFVHENDLKYDGRFDCLSTNLFDKYSELSRNYSEQ